MKIFDKYTSEGVVVEDPALKRYINFDERLVPKSQGRTKEKFSKSRYHVIERFVSVLAVPGHRGKKHRIMTSQASGKYNRHMKMFMETMRIIEEKTKKNPIQVIIKAIENASPRDEVTTIEYGGARYPQAVDISPTRRLSIAVRNMVHGAQDKSFGKKTSISQALANEIMKAAEKSNESLAISKKNEVEKQADSAR